MTDITTIEWQIEQLVTIEDKLTMLMHSPLNAEENKKLNDIREMINTLKQTKTQEAINLNELHSNVKIDDSEAIRQAEQRAEEAMFCRRQ